MRSHPPRPKSRLSRLRLERLEDRTTPVAGALDTSFGGRKVVTPIGTSDDFAQSVAIQADNKIVVAGFSDNGSNYDFAVARYNPDGSLDTSFDNDGKVRTPVGSAAEVCSVVTIQPDGKIILAGHSFNGSNYDLALVRYNPDGSLDSSFDGDGKLTTAVGSSDDFLYGISVRPNGTIVVAGYSNIGGQNDFTLVRYNSDGSLDTSLDGDGKLNTDFGSATNDGAASLAVQADGKIILAGYSTTAGGFYDFGLVRYNSDGSLDSTFDGDGKLTTAFGALDDYALSVKIQADGKIVAGGFANIGGQNDFALVRYNSNGSLDSSFDSDGMLTTAVGTANDNAYGIEIQADGKIVVAGYSVDAGNVTADFALVRYLPNGSLDTSFDGDGKLTTPIGSANDIAYGIALQADGKIVAAGYSVSNNKANFAFVRYKTDGSLDLKTEGTGKMTTPIGSTSDGANGVAIQADGKILVAGSSLGINSDLALARYNADGSLDASFGIDGKVTTPTSSDQQATCVAIQSDGKIVVAGYSENGGNFDFVVARYNTNGSLDTDFDSDGILTTAIGAFADVAYSVAIQADGKIVAAGYSNSPGATFALVRYNTDGSLDTTFDGDGKLTTSFTNADAAFDVAIQADGKIVAAGYSYLGVYPDEYSYFGLARYNPDGSLDTSFNSYGVLITAIGPTNDGATSVAIQADGKIVAGGYSQNASGYDFALTRYNSNGSLDTTFDGDGKLTTPIGLSFDQISSVAIQADGKIVASGASFNGSNHDFALVRYNTDGSLDLTFAGDGKFTTHIGDGPDQANSMTLQPDGRIVAAGSSYDGTRGYFALIRVRGDNHAPATVPTTFALTEDIDLEVADPTFFSDPDGDTVTSELLVAPTHGTLQFNPDGSFTYSPDAEFVGQDSFLYKVTDPEGRSEVGAITLNVINDAADRLEIITSLGVVTFTESDPLPSTAIAIDSTIKIGSAFEDTITSATVKITSGYVPKKDILTFAKTSAIKGKFNAKTGTLTLTGKATTADYELALQSVKYTNPSAAPVDGIRTIAFTVKDSQGIGDPAIRLLNVVGVNTKPILTLTGSAQNYKSRGKLLAAAGSLKIKDVDNTRLMGATISIGSLVDVSQDILSVKTRAGITATFSAGVLTLTGNATLKDYQAVLRSLKFTTPVGAAAGTRTISIAVTDGLLISDAVTRDLMVL